MENCTKIILIRHGQSIGNAKRIILGHTDLDLTDLGYLQANTTAEYLKNEKIDKIYSSDLKRAYNTAIPHAKLRQMDVITSEQLREVYLGAWEGLHVDDIIAKWGREAFEVDWHGHFGTFEFPEGEAIRDAGYRFFDEIKRISSENIGKTILITAHAAVIRAFWAVICHVSWENVVDEIPFASNASYSICYYRNGEVYPDSYSNDSHLAKVGITKVKLL